jgi:MATE family multidrug resistance protein
LINVYTNKHIFKISAPIFLSLLTQNLIQVVDTAFLGRVGEVELGASALAGVIYIAIYTLGFGFSMGSQILIGRRNGEKNYNKIGDIVIQGSIFLLIPAIVLIPILRYGAVNWIPQLFQSADVSGAVTEYLEWRLFGLIFAFVNLMFRAFYIGIARTKILTINAAVMAVVLGSKDIDPEITKYLETEKVDFLPYQPDFEKSVDEIEAFYNKIAD